MGKIVAHSRGVDIQKIGSGNIGFANVTRNLDWSAGWKVLLFDVLKGFIPSILAVQYLHTNMIYVVGLAAIAGHLFPVWLKFKGGKGIATGFGSTLAFVPYIAISGILVYVLAYVVFRKSAVSSLFAAWSMPAFAFFINQSYPILYLVALAVIAALTHRKNIKDLIKEKW